MHASLVSLITWLSLWVAPSLHAQSCPVIWGPTRQVSHTTTSAYVPKLAVVGDTVHVVYHPLSGILYRKSTDGGLTWNAEIMIVRGDSMSPQIWNRPFAASGSNLYFVWGTQNQADRTTSVKVRRSTDGGENWLEPQVIIPNQTFVVTYVMPHVTAEENQVYVVTQRSVVGREQCFLSRSVDHGATWDSVRQITVTPEAHGIGDIQAIRNTVYLALLRAMGPSGVEIAFMVSTDRGMSWSDEVILSTIDAYRCWEPDIAVDGIGRVYVSWQDAKYGTVGGFDGTLILRRSTDNGTTWLPEQRIGSLPSVERSAIAVLHEQVHVLWDDNRFGSLSPRVYYSGSTDHGTTWCNEIMLGDPALVSFEATVAASHDNAHAAWSMRIPSLAQVHHRRGVIITDIHPPELPLPSGFAVSPFYPNPFNPSTRVHYTVPYRGKLTITVYDMLGRTVKVLLDEWQSAGVYHVEFDGADVPSGIYFIRFHFDALTVTRAVALVR